MSDYRTLQTRFFRGWRVAVLALMAVSCMRVRDHVGSYPPQGTVRHVRLHLRDGTRIGVRSPEFRMDSITGLTDASPRTRIAFSVNDVNRIVQRRFNALDTAVLLVAAAVIIWPFWPYILLGPST